jgi:hypothetical protein
VTGVATSFDHLMHDDVSHRRAIVHVGAAPLWPEAAERTIVRVA